MSNMSYCRFENTYKDLQDCADNLGVANISDTEKEYRKRLIELCSEIVAEAEEFEEDEDDE